MKQKLKKKKTTLVGSQNEHFWHYFSWKTTWESYQWSIKQTVFLPGIVQQFCQCSKQELMGCPETESHTVNCKSNHKLAKCAKQEHVGCPETESYTVNCKSSHKLAKCSKQELMVCPEVKQNQTLNCICFVIVCSWTTISTNNQGYVQRIIRWCICCKNLCK